MKLSPTVETLPDPCEAARQKYADVRSRLKDIEAKIHAVDDAAWRARQSDDVEAAARAMLAGDETPHLPHDMIQQRAALVRQREVLQRAVGIAREAFDAEKKRQARAIARSLEPEHRKAVADIARALRQLSAALDREAAVHDRIPGSAAGALPRCGLPGIGSLGRHDSVASFWLRSVAKAGYGPEIAEGGE